MASSEGGADEEEREEDPDDDGVAIPSFCMRDSLHRSWPRALHHWHGMMRQAAAYRQPTCYCVVFIDGDSIDDGGAGG